MKRLSLVLMLSLSQVCYADVYWYITNLDAGYFYKPVTSNDRVKVDVPNGLKCTISEGETIRILWCGEIDGKFVFRVTVNCDDYDQNSANIGAYSYEKRGDVAFLGLSCIRK